MKVVAQRASRAAVRVEGKTVAAIGRGLVLLVGIERGDCQEQVERAAERFAFLRVFEDGEGKLNRSLGEVGGEILVVSQFTLAGSLRRGRRPSFDRAARAEEAEPLVNAFVAALRRRGLAVACGVFGAHMEVELVNDGPVTLIWDDPPGGGNPA